MAQVPTPAGPRPEVSVSPSIPSDIRFDFSSDEFVAEFRKEWERVGLGLDAERRLERDGMPLQWCGSLSESLGLTGETDSVEATRIVAYGVLPGGRKVYPDRLKNPAWSFFWAAPKTISLVAVAHPDPQVRDAATAAVREAGAVYLETLEKTVTIRRGTGSINTEAVRGLFGFSALHLTSNSGDPHAHVHFVLSSVAPAASDGRWYALDGRQVIAAQRLAAAAADAALRRSLSSHLHLGPLEDKQVGSVLTFEIASLTPAIETLSQATRDLEAVAQRAGIPDLNRASARQHEAAWRKFREMKNRAGEAMEHVVDALLSRGGQPANRIRLAWRKLIGMELAAELDRISVRETPETTPHSTYQYGILLTAPKVSVSMDEVSSWGGSEGVNTALSALQAPSLKQRVLARLGKANDKQVVSRYEEQRQLLESRLAACRERESRAPVEARATHVLEALASMGTAFTPTDVVAYLLSVDETGLHQAHKDAAILLRWWTQNGDLQLREGYPLEAVLQALDAGGISDRTEIQHAMGFNKALIPSAALRAELRLAETARGLSEIIRQPLLVGVDKQMTTEQQQAATAVCQGRAVTVTSGVAGAGKSFLARPIVTAAQKQGFSVQILSRNRALAENLAVDLGLGVNCATTLASFDPEQKKDQKTFWVLDESGLADFPDLQSVLDAVKRNGNWQLWAIGDRQQAQSIDKKAAFGVLERAVTPEAYTHLTKSYRCRAWEQEHELLRNRDLSVIELVGRDNRIVKTENLEDGIQTMAVLTQMYSERGENVLALTKSNERAAAISEYVQILRKIVPEEQTELRFGQKAGIGDVVRTRQNDRKKGIRNGQTWKVVKIGETGSLLLERHGKRVLVGKGYSREAVELGYAGTIDSAQGVTADRVILDVAGLGASSLYSGATRGKLAPVYVESPDAGLATALQVSDLAETLREIWLGDLPEKMAQVMEVVRRTPPPDRVDLAYAFLGGYGLGLIEARPGEWTTGSEDKDRMLGRDLIQFNRSVSPWMGQVRQRETDAKAARAAREAAERQAALEVTRRQEALLNTLQSLASAVQYRPWTDEDWKQVRDAGCLVEGNVISIPEALQTEQTTMALQKMLEAGQIFGAKPALQALADAVERREGWENRLRQAGFTTQGVTWNPPETLARLFQAGACPSERDALLGFNNNLKQNAALRACKEALLMIDEGKDFLVADMLRTHGIQWLGGNRWVLDPAINVPEVHQAMGSVHYASNVSLLISVERRRLDTMSADSDPYPGTGDRWRGIGMVKTANGWMHPDLPKQGAALLEAYQKAEQRHMQWQQTMRSNPYRGPRGPGM